MIYHCVVRHLVILYVYTEVH